MTSSVSLILQPSLTPWSRRAEAFEDLLGIFGSAMDHSRARKWLRAFAKADFSELPPVITLSAEHMPGLWGGYSREKNRIYLSADCPPEHLAKVLIEEVGHFLDRELCASETLGEEGARFAAMVLGKVPSFEQLAAWAADEGWGWVVDQSGPVLVEGAKKKSGGGGKKKNSARSKSGGSSGKNKKKRATQPGDSSNAGDSSEPLGNRPPKPSDFQDDPVQSYPGETLTGSSGSTFVVSDPANVTIGGNLTGTETIQTDADGLNLENFTQIENASLTGGADIGAGGNSLGNVITGNYGRNTLSGREGNDTLIGLAGNDSLVGGDGNDSMVGGTGNDTFVVDSATDVVVENADEGTDWVQASASYTLAANVEHLELKTESANINGTGNELGNSLIGNSGSNVLSGLGGNDTLLGGEGADTLLGGSGEDLIDGGAGNNSMVGGAGNDSYVVDSATDVVLEAASEGTDVVRSSISYTLGENLEALELTGSAALNGTGNSAANSITGNSGNNVLSGLEGNDTLLGGDGNDSLDGGTGNDSMVGGAGNDSYVVDSSTDVVLEAASEGTDVVRSSISYALGDHLEALELTGSEALNGTGNSVGNTITGNSENNVLSGLGGNDTLLGGDGNDSLDGGTGNDSMVGGAGNDTFVVGSATDVVVEAVGGGTDVVRSSISYTLGTNLEALELTGSAALNGAGNSGSNMFTGNSGNNLLTGNGGNDTFIGGEGNDTLVGGTGADSMDGGTGNDSMVGGGGLDTLLGGSGNDTLVVNPIDTVIVDGGADNDTLKFVSTSGMTLGDSDFGGYSNIESYDFTGVTGNVDITIGLNAQNLGIATLAGGTANSTLTANSDYTGSVHFTGGALADSLSGNSGNDTLAGAGGNDTMVGGSGADSLDGGLGNDSMVGGLGNDTYVVDSSSDVIVENASEGTDVVRSSVTYILGSNIESLELTGTANIDGTGDALANTLTGNTGNNVLAGMGGNDTLLGGAGNDSLDGGAGNDSLVGGAGNDTFVVDSATDVVVEATGEGTDEVRASVNFTLGSNFERLVLTGTAVSGIGNILANTVTGNASANSLDGGAGIDSLVGGAGDDTYFVDNAGDLVFENTGEGTDLAVASVSGYTLAANVESLLLAGIAVSGTGNSLANTLTGNASANSLDGGAGIDSLIGGAGNDTYFVDAVNDAISDDGGDNSDWVVSAVSLNLSNVLVAGGNAIENLVLVGTAVSGTGNALNNSLVGNSLGNSLNGGTGNDTMVGGAGDDTFVVDSATDVVVEAAGEGTDLVVASVAGYSLGANVEQLQLAGAVVSGTGNSLANTLTGNATGNSLDGGVGIDSLIGGAGNDTYVVDNSGDVVFENADEGEDLVQSSVSYTLAGNIEKLTLTGTAIAATGNSLANTLTGNASANSLDGGSGIDSMVGGSGNDTYFVDNVGDVVFENASEGTDAVVTTVDGYTMASEIENLVIGGTGNLAGSGSAGNNLLTGNSGNNLLTGNGGNDTFIGGEGNDSLVGGTGADSMDGGTGNDSMVGGGGLDTLLGGSGNDTLVVNPIDTVIVDGGADNDTLRFVSTSGMTLGDDDFGGFSNIESYDFTGVTGNVDITIGLNAQNLGIATLAGGTANSTLTANSDYSGSVHFTGGTLADSLSGNSGNDTLAGAGGNDTMVGGSGADSLDGGLGNDSMVGGLGNDTYVVDSSSDVIVENASEGTDVVRSSVTYTLESNIESLELTGTANIDGTGDALANTLTGNTGNNVLAGMGGNDTLLGGAGNDSLDGGTGNDSMVGGAGDDTFVIDSASDVIAENANQGTDWVQSGMTYTLGSNFENLELTGSSNINGTGNELANSIFGNSGNNSLDGLGGNDTIFGNDGNDTLVADATGTASLVGGDDNDSFLFSSGTQMANNTVVGGAGTEDKLVLTAATTLADAQLARVSGVEAIQVSSLAGNSITVGANAVAGGVLSLFGGASSDLLSAAGMVSGNIWIQGDAVGGTSTLGDTLIAGVGSSRATLVGNNSATADNYFQISTASLLGNNSIVGGAASDDYLQITGSSQTLSDSSFTQVSDLDGLILTGGSNTITLGVTAQAKFGTNITLTGGASGGDTINLASTTKKVWVDASAGTAGDTITAGTNDNTLIGGAAATANDLFIFTSESNLNGASVVGGGGTDTLRLSANGQTVLSAALDKLSSIEVFDLAGAGNNITLGAISAGITTIVGGTGPNTFNAASYNSAPNALTWNMSASNGSDSLLGGANGNLFQIRNGANLQNSVITGNTGNDTIQLLAGAETLGDSTFSNISGTSIEQLVLGSATNGNSITLGTIAASKGIDTVIGGTGRDTINASGFGDEIWIDASASSGARLVGSTTAPLGNTLIGGSAGGNEFVVGSLGANSIVGGSNGLDTLTFSSVTTINDSVQNGQLHDGSTASISKVGTIEFNAAGNNIVLGQDALIAGIRTLVGGAGSDNGTGNTFNTSAYGSAGVLFQITDQVYLSNITDIIGGTGVDTLKFSRDGVSVTDEISGNLTSIEVLRTANGNNRFLFDDDYLTAGIETIIGGTGRDTIDMASNLLYTPTTAADIITVDASAGAGYTLVSTTHNFAYAKVIGSSTNKGAVILDGANLFDADFLNMYQGNIGTLTMRDQTPVIVSLAENAVASGLDQLQLGADNDLVYVTDFAKELTIRGGTGDDRVFTSFAALSSLTFVGGDNFDILILQDAEARSITSLSGNFEALRLENGNNFVLLENEASRGGITRIIGGEGFDTLSAINLETGIDFQVYGHRLGNGNTDASIQGGSGVDTLSVDFLNPAIINTFNDSQFVRVGAFGQGRDRSGEIEAFNTQADGCQDYIFASNAFRAGIRTIYGHDGDLLDAFLYDDVDPATTDVPSLNFVFATIDDLLGLVRRSTQVIGSAGVSDTITLTTSQQIIFAGDFANHDGVERLVLAGAANDALFGNTVALDAFTNTAGIREIVFGVGRDILGFISTVNTSFTLQGGSGDDLAFLGNAAATLGDAAFTDWTSIEEFSVDVANGNNDITFGLQAQEAGIVTIVGGANNDTLNASAYTTASVTLTGDDGDDSLLSGAGNDSISGDNGDDFLSGASPLTGGVGAGGVGNEIDTLTGGAGADTFALADASNPYYYGFDSGAQNYALITDFDVASSDKLQLKSGVDYVIGGANYGALGGANSYLYLDFNANAAVDAGEDLIAAIRATGGAGAGGALTQANLAVIRTLV